MCVFTAPVEQVSNTRIFGRVAAEQQFVVYEMNFSAAQDVAMVLPIPVVAGASENVVRFISLEHYADFFGDLNRLFPVAMQAGMSPGVASAAAAARTLVVHEVGAFEASFVPTIADFSRLDPRFQLPEQVWNQLPDYKDFGFAVFQFAAGNGQHAHPMAFSFPTRNPECVFFPTVHIHDGYVHPQAMFDHSLYCQTDGSPAGWEISEYLPSSMIDLERTRGVIVDGQAVCRRKLRGRLKNTDTYMHPFGETALIAAVLKKDGDRVRSLLASGADVHHVDQEGETALLHSVRLGSVSISAMLMDADADLDYKNGRHETPLRVAAKKGHTEIARQLLERGADPGDISRNSVNAWYLAESFGHRDISAMIRKAKRKTRLWSPLSWWRKRPGPAVRR